MEADRDRGRPQDRSIPKRPTSPAFVTTSWDDGHVYDFAVADLLDEYDLPGTFYIAPRNCELAAPARLGDRDIAHLSTRFEIGAHTLTHLRLTTLAEADAMTEIVSGLHYLEDCIGDQIRCFCYPGGEYAPTHTEMVREAGFELARTVERHRIDLPSSLMEVSTTFHAYQHLRDGRAALRMSGGDVSLATRFFFHWDEWAIALFERVRCRRWCVPFMGTFLGARRTKRLGPPQDGARPHLAPFRRHVPRQRWTCAYRGTRCRRRVVRSSS